MGTRKHVYYITVSDVQHIAKETIGRSLDLAELAKVTDKILDNIQWYDVVEEAVLSEANKVSS